MNKVLITVPGVLLAIFCAACSDDATSTGGTGGMGTGGGGVTPGAGGGGVTPGAGGGGVTPGAGGGGVTPGAGGGGVTPGAGGGGVTPGAGGGGVTPGAGGGGVTPGAGGGGVTPAAGGTGPAAGGTGPAAGGTGPAAGGTGPAAGGTGPAAGGAATGGGDQGTGGVVDPNAPIVQLDKTYQTIQGFGINTALMPGEKTVPVDKLFGTTGADAIGLSILRIGMTPEGDLTGKYVSEAKAKGAKIIGSCWSPPADCKSNGNTQQGGHLKTPSEDGDGHCYADWSDKIANFAEQQGLYAMSIANESDFASCKSHGPPCTDDYDTTTYTAKQMVEWVKVAGPKLQAKGIKVIAPEASEWIHAWSNASATGSEVQGHPESTDALGCGCFSNTPTDAGCAQKCLDGDGYDYGHWLWDDQDAWASFDIFGVHEYDSQIAYAWPADVNGGVMDKEVWQTEMSGVKHWPEQGPTTDINNGVVVAGWIHSALTVGNASAWLWWWYESYYQNDNEGLAIVQNSSTTAKRYYTLGNYSKFVRPDYLRVDVPSPSADVLLSAFKKADGSTVVIVAVNKSGTAASPKISFAGGTAPTSCTPTVTSESANLQDGTAVAVTDGALATSLPGKTVTTYVCN